MDYKCHMSWWVILLWLPHLQYNTIVCSICHTCDRSACVCKSFLMTTVDATSVTSKSSRDNHWRNVCQKIFFCDTRWRWTDVTLKSSCDNCWRSVCRKMFFRDTRSRWTNVTSRSSRDNHWRSVCLKKFSSDTLWRWSTVEDNFFLPPMPWTPCV